MYLPLVRNNQQQASLAAQRAIDLAQGQARFADMLERDDIDAGVESSRRRNGSAVRSPMTSSRV